MLASANEVKRINPVNKSIDRRTNGAKVWEDAVMNKPEATTALIHNALEAGIRNQNNKDEYIVPLSTDCSLSASEVVRRYGNRWPIVCYFKTCKSLLKLEKKFHGVSYDLTVSTVLKATFFIQVNKIVLLF